MPRRHPIRRPVRALGRRSDRRSVRLRWRSPDYLAQALTAVNRLLRCNRRLAKLAPDFFDPVVVERLAREREERRRWQAEWEPALNKVYGQPPSPEPDPEPLPPLPAPRIQRRIDELLVERAHWLAVGSLALRHYRTRRPQRVARLSQLARLLWSAVQLGRWAAGIPEQPEPPVLPPSDPWADLARAYPMTDVQPPLPGKDDAPSCSGSAAPATPRENVSPVDSQLASAACSSRREEAPSGVREPEPSSVGHPGMGEKAGSAPSIPTESAPDHVRVGRRDVWSSWARQLRRNTGRH